MAGAALAHLSNLSLAVRVEVTGDDVTRRQVQPRHLAQYVDLL